MRQIRATCVDLYSTLIHETGNNGLHTIVAKLLGIDGGLLLGEYRKAGRACVPGQAPGRALSLFYASIAVDPMARETLAGLRADGLLLALVSNASGHSESLLDSTGLRAAFDAVVLSYQVGVLKPDPAIYLAATSALGVRPDECVFVGDGGDDELGGARRLGMRTILLDRGLAHTDAARRDADHTVTSLAEVPGLLREPVPEGR